MQNTFNHKIVLDRNLLHHFGKNFFKELKLSGNFLLVSSQFCKSSIIKLVNDAIDKVTFIR